jgi:L-fuconate dehydratase
MNGRTWSASGRPAGFKPLWIEEPTSPDDILGHAAIRRAVAPIGVATGEHGMNRVLLKQTFQAEAIDFCQLDAARLASVNEIVAVYLLAHRFGVPVCPHAGGVGLCELVQHLSIFDYVAVSGSLEGRVTEYVDHLHEHFVDPCLLADGHYLLPDQPGYSAELKADTIATYSYPDGTYWAERAGEVALARAGSSSRTVRGAARRVPAPLWGGRRRTPPPRGDGMPCGSGHVPGRGPGGRAGCPGARRGRPRVSRAR